MPDRPTARRVDRPLALVAIAVAVLIGSATFADATTLTPTDWRSTLVSVAPTSDVLRIEVFEGGEAIRAVVTPGHTLTVPGYAEEPYLRITGDGTVEANVDSPTWWSNHSRTGDGPVPDSADASAPPDWRRIGGGGAITWHDHRIHAMPGTTGDSDWTVTVAVDGLPHVARGRLARLPSHSPVLTILTAAVLAVAVSVLGRRRARRTTSIAVSAAATLAVALEVGEAIATPPGMDVHLLPLLVGVASLVLGILAASIGRRARRAGILATTAAIGVLVWWCALMLPTPTAAIVPNAFADPIVRAGLAIVMGLVVGAAVLLVRSGAFADEVAQTDAAPVA